MKVTLSSILAVIFFTFVFTLNVSHKTTRDLIYQKAQ